MFRTLTPIDAWLESPYDERLWGDDVWDGPIVADVGTYSRLAVERAVEHLIYTVRYYQERPRGRAERRQVRTARESHQVMAAQIGNYLGVDADLVDELVFHGLPSSWLERRHRGCGVVPRWEALPFISHGLLTAAHSAAVQRGDRYAAQRWLTEMGLGVSA